jgi:hypothetical protein
VNEDLAHDAHLRAALRHAPDHALSPPSRVTQTILAAARQAHRQEVLAAPVPPPPMRRAGAPSLRHWLRRTASPRWAGAWAVALLAALGWGLWLDLGPRPEEEHPGGGAAAPTVAANESTQQGPTTDAPVRVNADKAPPQARTEAAASLAKSGEVATPRASAAAQAPRPAVPPTANDVLQRPSAAGVLRGRGGERDAEAKFAERDAEAPPLALLRRAQSEVATGSAHWTWSAPGRPVIKPLDSTAMAWLARVAQTAEGPWREIGDRGEGVEAVAARWWRDGWPAATLRIEAHGLRWIEPGGPVLYAPLDAATSQQLRGS